MKKLLRIAVRIFAVVVALLISLSLIVLIPSVQTWLVNTAGSVLSEKTGMPVKVGSVHIAFPKTIRINEIFMSDSHSDTLLYTEAIKMDLDLLPLLRKQVSVSYLQISGLRSRVYRNQGDTLFNYLPLIAAFVNPEKTEKKTKPLDWRISLRTLEFKDFRISYEDQVDSMFMNLDLGLLSLDAKNTDLQNMSFEIGKASLLNTSMSMRMLGTAEDSIVQPSEKAKLPFQIMVEEINLDNISYDLQIGKDNLLLQASVHHADALPDLIDLPEEKIQFREFNIEGVDVALQMNSSPVDVEMPKDAALEDYTFGNFNWDFLVRHASIKNISYVMDIGEKSDTIIGMDYGHMAFSDFNAKADSIFFNKNTTGALLHSMSLREKSGPQLMEMKGRFSMDNQGIYATDVVMKTLGSYVEGSASLGYSALRNIGSEISMLEINSKLRGKVTASEILPFAPIIADIPFLNKIDGLQNIRVQTAGPLGNLEVREATFSLGNEGFFSGQCAVKGLPSLDLDVQFQLDSVYLSGEGLRAWAPDSLFPDNFNLPNEFFLKAAGETNLVSGYLSASLVTDLGNASLEMNKWDSTLTAYLSLDNLSIGQIIDQPLLGKISMSTDATIELSGFAPTAFTSKTKVSHIGINNYPLTGIEVDVALHENKYKISMLSDDPALCANLDAAISEEDSALQLSVKLNLEEANLQDFGFMDEPFSLGSDITLSLDYENSDVLNTRLLMQNVKLTNEGGPYHIAEASLEVKIDENTANYTLRSDVVDASLIGNTKISELGVAVIDQIDRHIAMPDSILNPKNFVFDLNVDWKKPDILTGFLIKDLKEFELTRCQAHYNDEQNILTASIDVPRIKYTNLTLDTISFRFDSHRDSSVASMKLNNFSIDSAYIRNISLESAFSTDNMKLRFETHDTHDNLKYRLHGVAEVIDSAVTFSMNPKNLLINYLPWSLPAENMLRFDKNTIVARQTVMTNGSQKVSLSTERNDLKLQFDNFRLRNIIGILEGDTAIRPIKGFIDGHIVVGTWPEYSRMDAFLDVHDVKIHNKYLGNVHAEAKSGKGSTEFAVIVENDMNNIEANGYLTNKNDETAISIITEYDINDASSFQPFMDAYIDDFQGKLNGRLSVSGTLDAPLIFGNVSCEDLGGTIPQLNSLWTTTGDITIVRNRFEMDSFFLIDAEGNKLALSGSIDGSEITRPFFDVKLHSDNFLVVDNGIHAENTLSGKLAMGIDILAKGYMADIVFQADLKINKETDAVYTMPGKELELITDNGIVAFADLDQSTADAMATEMFSIQDSITSLIQGINLTTNISIDPEARFTVSIDPISGDYTKFKLNGKLNYIYNNNIRGRLRGLLELNEGFYELSFYGLVKKRFDFVPGSTVRWAGDIMDGDINFSAKITVRTNSVGLVSDQISSSEKALYNQRLPYDVILKVNDKISNPTIGFALDLPQSFRGSYPTLDTKLNILNQPSMESERNKQVFALLVGGTFLPENPDVTEGSSSQNFATTAAINSVNAIMTQQLNNLTGQIIKNFDVDMGVNTFDDFTTGSAQTRTQMDVKVSRNLFNDRVSAEVEGHINLDGSNNVQANQNDAGQMEFAVSYKLTPTGNYRIKLFRENAFDIFDGEIQNSGIALIFVREFNSFSILRKKTAVPSDSTLTTPETDHIED